MNHSTEDGVLPVQMRTRHIANEKLGAVSVRTSVGHREQTLVCMLDPDSFISKFRSINALVTLAVRCYNFASLHHEVRDDSLDLSTLVK